MGQLWRRGKVRGFPSFLIIDVLPEGLPPVVCCIVGKASSQGMFSPPARNDAVTLFCYGS